MLLFRLFSKTEMYQHPPVKRLLSLGAWLLVILTLFIASFRLFESMGWQEAVWQVWQTATTVGYGNHPAQTLTGQWATMILGLLSIAFLGAGISTMFEVRAYFKDRKRCGLMKNPIKNGYVIFNFPGVDILHTFIREVRFVEEGVGICIVDENLEELPKSIAALDNIHFIRGEILDHSTYERAALTNNKIVVVFPTSTIPESDGTTKTVVDLVLKFIDNAKTRVVYSLVKPANAWMFDCRATGAPQTLNVLALVQECQDKYSSIALDALLKNTEGPNPETVIPKFTIGLTWQRFVEGCTYSSSKWRILMTPLAIIRKDKAYVCPPLDMVIEEGDSISIIAYEGFSWDFFERQITFCQKR